MDEDHQKKGMAIAAEYVLRTASSEVQCIECGDTEFVLPLDDRGPLDVDFLTAYVCDDCEIASQDSINGDTKNLMVAKKNW